MYYLSTNTFKLLVKKESSKSCTVMSLSSGKIYRSTTDQIFNSKKGKIAKLSRRNKTVEVEKSIYGLLLEGKLGKGVTKHSYELMLKKLKPIDSYAKIKIK